MIEYPTVLAFAALPALGNFAGGLLAEVLTASERTLSLALHAAAGVVIAVVAVELMPEALQAGSPLIIILAFVAGGVFFVVLDQMTQLVKTRLGSGNGGAGPWVIFLGVAIDLFSDGVMIGTGSTVATDLGFLLALGQIPADILEGLATIITFKHKESRARNEYN